MHRAAACRPFFRSTSLARSVAAVTVLTAAGSALAGPVVLPAAAAAPCPPAAGTEPANRLDPAEPEVGLRVPAGWHRDRSRDSRTVRLTIVDSSRAKDPAAATVTVERVPGKGGAAASVLASQVESVRPIATAEPAVTRGNTCGFPSAIVSYTAAEKAGTPATPAKSLVAAVPRGADAYVVAVTLRTTDPSDEGYQRATGTILRGLHIG